MNAKPKVAIYARLSMDRAGTGLGVARQVKACRDLCERMGFEVGVVYEDNDTSATNGKRRPGFEALLADRPEAIVVWHVDRLVRVTRDLERVIELGVNVHAVEAGHLDLSNPAGRAVARTVTAWSTYETEQKAVRQKLANDQRAEAGLPYRCQRAFGYEPGGMVIREAEAAELRAAADGVLAGRSLNALARDLNERGVPTATGKTWRTTTLKAALLSPRNAGLRRHRGEVVGKAAWPAILDEATAAAVRAILTDPTRAKRGPDRRYLLSGTMTCGKCGAPVVGAYVKGKGETYRCPKIHVTRKAAPADEYILEVVTARLARPDAAQLFTRPDRSAEVEALRVELAQVRARLDGLAEAFAVGDIDRQALAAGSKRLHERAGVIEASIGALAAHPAVASVVTAQDVAGALRQLPREQQRQVVATLLDIELVPVGGGRRAQPWDGMQIKWKESAGE